MLRTACTLATVVLVASHAAMSIPPPRQMHGKPIECYHKWGKEFCNAGCPGQSCLWYQVGCMVGCDTCSLDGKEMWPTPSHVQCTRNGTAVPPGRTPYPVPRTLPAAARTWNIESKSPMGDFTAYMPWSSPGASALVDSCGVASGFGANAPKYVKAPIGYKVGDKGSTVLAPTATRTIVQAGGTFEAGFGFEVNHGGGYAYRLCPAGSPLTEECFQAHHLEFASSNHTIKYVADKSKADVVLPAMTITEGTTPRGTPWRRVPFPACNCDLGEGCHVKTRATTSRVADEDDGWSVLQDEEAEEDEEDEEGEEGEEAADPNELEMSVGVVEEATTGKLTDMVVRKRKGGSTWAYEQQPDPPPRCPTGTQFPVPHDDLYGYADVPPVLITDVLRVPPSLPAGDYVLSWRWDCEQTPQIWNSCADLTVTKA